MGYKNAPKVTPRVGDVVRWHDGSEVVVTHLGDPPGHSEKCQIINCQFDDKFYLNRPEEADLIRDVDGTLAEK